MKRFLVLLFLALPISALACSDCDDEVCVGPFHTLCGCVRNIGRCRIIPPPERFAFCNITDGVPGDKPSCTNCSSNFSGDAGKADCLVRHQGNYVQSGECVSSECRTIN